MQACGGCLRGGAGLFEVFVYAVWHSWRLDGGFTSRDCHVVSRSPFGSACIPIFLSDNFIN